MKIVTITHANPKIHNKRINVDFVSKLGSIERCEHVLIEAYSKREKKILRTAKNIYEEHKPDVMILHSQHALLHGYLKDIPCLKACISVDFYKLVRSGRLNYYSNNNFDLVVHRSFYDENANEKIGLPSFWLPFSADEKDFYPLKAKRRKRRIKKIGFAGSFKAKVYSQRKMAIDKLQRADLIDFKKETKGRIIGPEYAEFLRNHVACLSSSEIKSPHGKNFEIMASGSALLVAPFYGHEELFGEYDPCMMFYKDDCSDIVERAKVLIEDEDQRESICNNALKCILENHTDDLRIRELYENLERMLTGKELVKKWGR